MGMAKLSGSILIEQFVDDELHWNIYMCLAFPFLREHEDATLQ